MALNVRRIDIVIVFAQRGVGDHMLAKADRLWEFCEYGYEKNSCIIFEMHHECPKHISRHMKHQLLCYD